MPAFAGMTVAGLLQTQCHEAELAIAAGYQEKRGPPALFLELVDLGLEVVGIGDRFLRDLDDDIAGSKPLVGSRRIRIDAEDDDALHGVLHLVFLAQVLIQIGKV